MKVLFLDVDGVLNSEAFLKKLDDQHRQLGHTNTSDCVCYRHDNQIDDAAVSRLNRIVATFQFESQA